MIRNDDIRWVTKVATTWLVVVDFQIADDKYITSTLDYDQVTFAFLVQAQFLIN